MELCDKGRDKGYSLVELLITLLLIIILSSLAIPSAASALANIKLRSAASNFAGLVQRARITAVQGNQTYTIRIGLPSGNGAYVDLNNNSTFDSNEPMIQFGGTANMSAAPGGASGAPTNLNATGGPIAWTATSGNISFNPRGLPCNSGLTPCGSNVNYIFYFKDTRYFGRNSWAAVSITSAARAKVWVWSGSNWID